MLKFTFLSKNFAWCPNFLVYILSRKVGGGEAIRSVDTSGIRVLLSVVEWSIFASEAPLGKT